MKTRTPKLSRAVCHAEAEARSFMAFCDLRGVYVYRLRLEDRDYRSGAQCRVVAATAGADVLAGLYGEWEGTL